MTFQGSDPSIVLVHTASGCTGVAGRAASGAPCATATRCWPPARPRRMGFDQIVHMFSPSPRIGEERND